jgi:hypothetical protein
MRKLYCIICGKEFQTKQYNAMTCSKECSILLRKKWSKTDEERERQKARQKLWRKNHNSPKETKVKKRLYNFLRNEDGLQRKRILKSFNGECYFCKSKEQLKIHHKTYNSNEIKNCLVLCLPCHRKLHIELRLEKYKIEKRIEESIDKFKCWGGSGKDRLINVRELKQQLRGEEMSEDEKAWKYIEQEKA